MKWWTKLTKKESILFSHTGTSTTIKKIREEFNDTSNNLLDSANELLKSLEEDSIKAKEKAKLLEELGFTNSDLVKRVKELEVEKAKNKKIADMLQAAKDAYPNYKYITEDNLLNILKKYNMIIGKVSEFNGYVPENNLLDIKKFFEDHGEDKYFYTKKATSYANSWEPKDERLITLREYNQILVEQNNPYPSKYRELTPTSYEHIVDRTNWQLPSKNYLAIILAGMQEKGIIKNYNTTLELYHNLPKPKIKVKAKIRRK